MSKDEREMMASDNGMQVDSGDSLIDSWQMVAESDETHGVLHSITTGEIRCFLNRLLVAERFVSALALAERERDEARRELEDAKSDTGFIGHYQYAHMCQNDHVRIGHNDSDYKPEELACPVCRLRAELEAVRGKATGSDRECVQQIMEQLGLPRAVDGIELECFIQPAERVVPARVAASVAPVQKRLDEAVGLLRWAIPNVCKACGSGHPSTASGVNEEQGFYRHDHGQAGTSICYASNIRAFLTPTTEQEEGQDGAS